MNDPYLVVSDMSLMPESFITVTALEGSMSGMNPPEKIWTTSQIKKY
jgi:hypothetical protein